MTKQEFIEFCSSISNALVDQPFENDFSTYAARHLQSRKWFALIMDLHGKTVVNLKCEPMSAEFYRKVYKGVIPAYHMNKRLWNTVYLQSDVPDRVIMQMTEDSFKLTSKGKCDKRLKNNEN
ncbi:MAG: MmcQ/YjbR family DNA-binding protein [Oscillospiraceae bacterium]